MTRPVKMTAITPVDKVSLDCDEVVVVAFVGKDTGWRALSYRIWHHTKSRRVIMHAAKALLSFLAEDTSDAWGKAAARALEQVHKKAQ